MLSKLLSVLQQVGEDDCAICLIPPTLPVITRCAHVFCRPCIEKALEKDKRCPLCRGECEGTDLVQPEEEVEEKEGEGGKRGKGEEEVDWEEPSAKVRDGQGLHEVSDISMTCSCGEGD